MALSAVTAQPKSKSRCRVQRVRTRSLVA